MRRSGEIICKGLAVQAEALRAWGSWSPRSPNARDLGHPHLLFMGTCATRQIGIALFGGCEDVVAFGDFRKHGMWERISEMKGEEVEAFFFFPMRKAAAAANVNFAVTWLHGAVEERGRIFLRHGAILSGYPSADEDVRATAGREAGATFLALQIQAVTAIISMLHEVTAALQDAAAAPGACFRRSDFQPGWPRRGPVAAPAAAI